MPVKIVIGVCIRLIRGREQGVGTADGEPSPHKQRKTRFPCEHSRDGAVLGDGRPVNGVRSKTAKRIFLLRTKVIFEKRELCNSLKYTLKHYRKKKKPFQRIT